MSSSGNFAIAGALADTDNKESVEHTHEHKHEHEHAHEYDSEHADHHIAHRAAEDGHHHAKTDAWASLVSATGVAFGSITGNSKFDLIGTMAAGAYFIYDMAKHMRKNGHSH